MKKFLLSFCLALSFSLQAQTDSLSFLNAPKIVQDPVHYPGYSGQSRKFTGIPSLAIAPGGRMWATWYTGITPGENKNNYVVVATSGDGGGTWDEVLVVDPDGAGLVRAFDSQLWVDPDHHLWLFWTQAIGHDGSIAGVWFMKTTDAGNKKAKWSSAQRLTDGVMMNKPTVLSNGDWLLHVSTWKTENSAKILASSNRGKSWEIRGAVHVPEGVRGYDEHISVERTDGSLWMLVRTKTGIGESTSKDLGKTWSTLEPSTLKHPSARFFSRRLLSGNLLLVKHGPISIKTGRSHLMAFISKDDGQTWSEGVLLDERLGVSYPDGQQTPDGRIYIIYDFDRTGCQNILLTSFTEEDLLDEKSDESMLKIFSNRKEVSKGGN